MEKLLVILIGLLTADIAIACKCMPLTLQGEIQISDKIFHGRVVSAYDYVFEVEIVQVWKGDFQTKAFRLEQGRTSCEVRTFETGKEYLFFVNKNSVLNCSRTEEYQLTTDPELLDLKFKSIGDRNVIESASFTDREIEIVRSLLKSRNINTEEIQASNLRLAVQDSWVDKWTFFESYRWTDWKFRTIKTGDRTDSVVIIWTGSNWEKSFKKLKKSL